jgi:hypothetical protein
MDEAWASQNRCTDYMWLPNDGSDVPKIPSVDFDSLIESFISLCIIETVGTIVREYKPWIVLLITQ